jgi:hypothetical protein
VTGTLLAVAGLGAFHGINPGMGWLFAVALGLQEGRAAAIWRGLAALTTGHALAVGAAIAAGGVARTMVPDAAIRLAIAALLIGMGAMRLVRVWHPRGGMRVGFGGLVGWSFLMASAHGAGLMVLPFVLGTPVLAADAHAAHLHGAATAGASPAFAAVVVHTGAYLVVSAIVAWIVYTRIGVALLRTAWINLDAVWAAALIVTGVVAALIS